MRTVAPFALALHQTPSGPTAAPMAVGIAGVRRVLRASAAAGRRFVPLSAVGPDGPPPGSATLTVDDGYASNILCLAPLLRELGVPWTVFVLVRTLGRSNRWDLGWVGHRERHLSAEDVRALAAEGVTIGSHGLEHRDFTRLDDRALEATLDESRARLAELAGRPVDAVSYPWGRVDARVARAAARAGYRLGFALRPPRGLPEELRALALPRTAVYAPDQIPGVFRATGPWAAAPLRALRDALTAAGGAVVLAALAARGSRHA
ncbi:MAG: polysaccharide deacetylase family protein [Hyphomicrobiales bacterium]